nr:hypothetical protein Iba_chr12aCG21080 [Ipomoea batatas]
MPLPALNGDGSSAVVLRCIRSPEGGRGRHPLLLICFDERLPFSEIAVTATSHDHAPMPPLVTIAVEVPKVSGKRCCSHCCFAHRERERSWCRFLLLLHRARRNA